MNINNFCKIGYHQEKGRATGKGKLRPYFQLAEAFCKNYAMDVTGKTGGVVPSAELAPFEVDFIKAV